MKFHLTNKTAYSGRDLRSFLLAGLRAEGDESKHYRIEVVYARQDYGCSGRATIGGSWMRLRIPGSRVLSREFIRPREVARAKAARKAWAGRVEGLTNEHIRDIIEDEMALQFDYGRGRSKTKREPFAVLPENLTIDLAKVFVHELLHNRGMRHGEMGRAHKRCQDNAPTPWATGLVIRRKVEKAKPTTSERVDARAEKARSMVERYERRLKIARTVLARWKRKVAYYDRRAAAAQGSPSRGA